MKPIAIVAVLVLLLGAGAMYCCETLAERWFGPPAVEAREAYATQPAGPTFDHAAFDAILGAHVDEDGWVGYAGILAQHEAQLNTYLDALAAAPFDKLGRDEKLALLINAYNAFTIRLILDHWDGGALKTIKDIPADRRWDAVRWNIGGNTWSLNQIEHEQVRAHFKEPRIHFALVCAAYSCPKLRNEAYTADRLDAQLEDQAVYTHTHERWYRFDGAGDTAHLTALYDWYGDDFRQAAGSVIAFVARYRDEIDPDDPPRITFLDYDWRLNGAGNKP